MIYLARTTDGVAVFDLGWSGAREAMRSALEELGADSSAVRAVFITHAHRDHIEGWPLVAGAHFYLAVPESDFLFGALEYRALIPRTADALWPPHLPDNGRLQVTEFMADTVIVVGADTVRAFPVPGHTAGSAAYLFRGILFVGDAITRSVFTGFAPARSRYSEDKALAVRSLRGLFERIEPFDVRYVCTAHMRCSAFTADFVKDVIGGSQ
jgi:glyoxylase-like metal-dependent hydrolase (beta-lactamase superfamily II)